MKSKGISKEIELKNANSNNKLENLKCDYFLQKILNNPSKKRALEFLKYNKKTQQRLNFNINNYKKYCEEYSSIEIEIIPVKNKYGKFINIKEGDEKYYHIYFNNIKDEIKREFINKNEFAAKIDTTINYQIKSFNKLFYNCKCIEKINFKKFARNNIIDMSYMFYGCTSLNYLNLSNFNTFNVTDMSYMFFECSLLKELNLNKFNTSKVINMSYMFSACSSLNKLDIDNFNTNQVTNISFMFYKCSLIKELNLSNFNTNNVTNMSQLFRECSKLTELNLINFFTDNVRDMSGMFAECSLLHSLNISNFNINSVNRMNGMFFNCSSLKELNISNFYIKEEIETVDILKGCLDELKKRIKFHVDEFDEDLDSKYLNDYDFFDK